MQRNSIKHNFLTLMKLMIYCAHKTKYSYCFLALFFFENLAKLKNPLQILSELVIKVSFNVEIAKYIEERREKYE